ncbi:unnamed protein product [Trichogramma brassicae]|uniref:Uncharacterized protein n=1 Tax=Trichogramma brassicae TaxID=86971 RepID=A0A6H5INM7_9HYME|nr:unnamed protein product [Trichogramma brassicae]
MGDRRSSVFVGDRRLYAYNTANTTRELHTSHRRDMRASYILAHVAARDFFALFDARIKATTTSLTMTHAGAPTTPQGRVGMSSSLSLRALSCLTYFSSCVVLAYTTSYLYTPARANKPILDKRSRDKSYPARASRPVSP